MKQYYILEGTRKIGPLNISDLKEKQITPTTYIWTNGLNEWKEAKYIKELSEILQELPPPPPPMPSNYLWTSLLSTIFCCLPLGIIGIIFSLKVSRTYYSGNYTKAEEYSEYALFWSFASAGVIAILLLLLLTIWLLMLFSNYGYENNLLKLF